MLSLGIDPGKTGAIVIAEDGIPFGVLRLGQYVLRGQKQAPIYDLKALHDGFTEWLGHQIGVSNSYHIDVVTIERTGAWGKNANRQTVFALAYTSGAIAAMVACVLDYPIRYVLPATWKADIGIAGTKGVKLSPTEKKHISLDAARGMKGWAHFSELNLQKVKDHDVAEAALINLWGYNMFRLEQRCG